MTRILTRNAAQVMRDPRVEHTAEGEVIVFPIRVNVNLKGITVRSLSPSRARAHTHTRWFARTHTRREEGK